MFRLSRLSLIALLSAAVLNASLVQACEVCGTSSETHGVPQGAPGSGEPVVAGAAPALSSRAGAAYTIYLNFDGFAFSGQWGTSGATPGTTAAYTGTEAQIRQVWARTAEKFAAFDVNVTTVDPAVAAGQAGSDFLRQRYYDNTARLMHTVVGGTGSWIGGGGYSYIGVTQNAYSGIGSSNGYHTNWAFANSSPNNLQFIGEVSAHENGHGFGLGHQSDYQVGGTFTTTYSSNGGAVGNGSYAPIQGNSYSSQRGTFRVGSKDSTSTVQNDVARIASNSGMSIIDDGIGHTFVTATALPLTGTSVNSLFAQGVIVPLSGVNANPIGIDNYSKDYFKFTMGQAGNVTLTLSNGGDWITPGVAAPSATLRSKLNLYRSGDVITPFAFGIEAANTLSSSFSGMLAAGDYFAEITSFGGYTSSYDPGAKYFDMGSYVLSGSGILPAAVAVPESGTMALIGVGLIGLIVRRKRK